MTIEHHSASQKSIPYLTKSPALSCKVTSPLSKRSPSPRITFTPSALPSEKGVQDITRKVIRTLEGLVHLDIVDMRQEEAVGRDEQVEVNASVSLNGHAVHSEIVSHSEHKRAAADQHFTNGSIPLTPRTIDWEIPRKVLHSSIGFFTIYLYISNKSSSTVLYVLWTALAVIIPAEVLRFRSPAFERFYERCLGFLMRESERHSTNGVVWYIIGTNVALTCYPLDVATVAVLILSWADTAASTIGRLWGPFTAPLPRKLPILHLPLASRKSVAGFLAASLTGGLVAVGFWGWIAPLRSNANDITWTWNQGVRGSSTLFSGWLGLGLIGLTSGLISGIIEALDVGQLDDNLTLPILAGGCLWGFFKLLGLASNHSQI